jgi:hypothetical protein
LLHSKFAGYSLNELFRNKTGITYEIIVNPAQREEIKKALRNFQWVKYVSYENYMPMDGCTRWNDPALFPNGWFADLPFLTDSAAVSFWASLPTIHSIDQIEQFKPFFQISTASEPNVAALLQDGATDTTSIELPNIIYKWRITTSGVISVIPSIHGNGVGTLIVGQLGNNNLWGWVASGYPLHVHDVWIWYNTVNITAAKIWLNNLYNYFSTQPWSDSSIRFGVNMSHWIGNDTAFHGIITLLKTLKTPAGWDRFFFEKSAGNSGPGTLDAACTWSEIRGIWAILNWVWSTPLWSWSSTWQGIWGVADGQWVYSMRSTNGTWTVANGSSPAAAIITWYTLLMMSEDELLDEEKIRKRDRAGAYDMLTPGYDTASGIGYLRAWKAIQYTVVEDYPNIDMVDNFATPLATWGAANFVKDFTPKYINWNQAQTRSCTYPNGQPVPFTVDTNGKHIYHPQYTDANGMLINGFTATNNVLTYKVEMPGACGPVDFPTVPFNIITSTPLSIQKLEAKLVGQNLISADYIVDDFEDIVEMEVRYTESNPADMKTIHSKPVTLTQKEGTFQYSANANGFYSIVAKAANGQEKVSNIVHVTGMQSEVKMYSDEKSVFVSGLNAEHTYAINIIDITGKVLASYNSIKGVSVTSVSINETKLPSGIYVFSLTDKKTGQIQTLKITLTAE